MPKEADQYMAGELRPTVLVVADEADEAAAAAIGRITDSLRAEGYDLLRAMTVRDGVAQIREYQAIGCLLLDWELGAARTRGEHASLLISETRKRSADLPIFLLADRTVAGDLPLEVRREIQEYVWLFEDTPAFIAGRVSFAVRRYQRGLLPPFFRALVDFSGEHEYSWHTPGHAGGTAFLKTPVGRVFHDFFGEQAFRSDLSVSVTELGSLLDHSGPAGAAEANAARIFGADMTFFVLNGTSTANQVVGHSCIVPGDVVLADRNCHKSLNYALTVTDARPAYLLPTRNGYGIIGPVPVQALTPAAVRSMVAASPLASGAASADPVYAVITNCTYDGLCYRVDRVVELLGESVPRLHFDEAWYAYAAFHPIYRNRFAMQQRPADPGRSPTIFATQSTHKLLAAFSQASMIHVRSSPRAPVDHARFNEAYMMHASTSPLYQLIASCDVAAGMLDGPAGRALTDESLDEAVSFRRAMLRTGRELASGPGPGWFFSAWQPDTVVDPDTGQHVDFLDVDPVMLRENPECWVLRPGEPWHGFDGLEDGYCMLDPIKVTIATPGVDAAGTVADRGIPAQIVTRFLDEQSIEVEKTGDYVILFLFSIGITRGKWGTLIDALLEFKDHYDRGASLADAIPGLAAEHPRRYAGLSLRGLCDQMHAKLRSLHTARLLDEAFGTLPVPVMPPSSAYQLLVRDQVEWVSVDDMGERVAAVMVVPYPPGIPLLMPGEHAGAGDGPVLAYLRALQDFDRTFPGFGHDIHGVQPQADGTYRVMCVKEDAVARHG
jgi:arginine decarboxylase